MNRYAVLGIAVIMVTGTFLLFSDYNGPGAYDYTGIVSDVHESTSGFVFVLNPDGPGFRCFSYEEPVDLGYYAVSGEFSDDGNIFFVSSIRNLDIEPFQNRY